MLKLLIILLVIFFWWYVRRNKWLFALDKTFKKHKQLGFPTLTIEEQCELLYPLDNNRGDVIKTKTGIYEEYPDKVLDYYITIGKNEMVQHLKKKNFRVDWKYQNDQGQDFCWLKEIGNEITHSYDLILRERGKTDVIHFHDYDEFLEYFAIQRLKVVPKYRLMFDSIRENRGTK